MNDVFWRLKNCRSFNFIKIFSVCLEKSVFCSLRMLRSLLVPYDNLLYVLFKFFMFFLFSCLFYGLLREVCLKSPTAMGFYIFYKPFIFLRL